MTLLYKIDKNKEWLDTAEKAAHYLIMVRDGGKTPEELNQDHWLMYGLNELYRLSPQKIYYQRNGQTEKLAGQGCRRVPGKFRNSQHPD
ncbi:hypothetical protein DS62_01655 [Smithella sp. SC_K08D17]|nr:hypothetical protein DS62_01655 [Smithella sp. SC_K08D17]